MTRKLSCGPYHLRVAHVGLHGWLEVQVPFLTLTLSALRR